MNVTPTDRAVVGAAGMEGRGKPAGVEAPVAVATVPVPAVAATAGVAAPAAVESDGGAPTAAGVA